MFLFGIGYKNTKPDKILAKKSKIMEFIIDETLIKVGSEFIWLCVAIEFESKEIIWNYHI
jgi:putative transposase